MDTLREINPHRKHLSKKVGSIPIHSFFKNSEKPQVKTFKIVILIGFVIIKSALKDSLK